MKRYTGILLGVFFTFSHTLYSQDLLQERIRQIDNRKRSIYIDQGIIHNGHRDQRSRLEKVRHSYSEERGFERLVFDFNTSAVPRVYGHLSSGEKKLYLDFFQTSLIDDIQSVGNSRLIDGINFFPVESDMISIEVILKDQSDVEIFYLNNPGRLVVDIKI